MERNEIARTDFATSRRGYSREEVDRHLQAVAAELERLEEERTRSGTLAGTAADRVREVIEAAERSASDIHSKAEQDARRTTERSDAQVRAAREKAEAELAEHAKRVEKTLERTLERATALESELGRVAEALLSGTGSLVTDVRGGIESVRAGLDEVQGSLPDGTARAVKSAEAEARAGGEAAESGATRRSRARSRGKEPRPEDAPKKAGAWAGQRSARPAGTADSETAAEAASGASPRDRSKTAAEGDGEGARMIALNMALKGTPREETARYLAGNFELDDPDAVVEEVYSKVRS